MIKQIPNRYKIPLDDVEKIVITIEAYQKLISFYEEWLEKYGPYEYVDERICALTSEYCEYLFAKEYAKEGARTFGSDMNVYKSVEKDFKRHFPHLDFIPPRKPDDRD
jgi:hypothetical protein